MAITGSNLCADKNDDTKARLVKISRRAGTPFFRRRFVKANAEKCTLHTKCCCCRRSKCLLTNGNKTPTTKNFPNKSWTSTHKISEFYEPFEWSCHRHRMDYQHKHSHFSPIRLCCVRVFSFPKNRLNTF